MNEDKDSAEEAISNQLNAAADEYAAAKAEFDRSQIRYEVAKKRLAVTKTFASDVMTPSEWGDWLLRHHKVRFAGVTIGEAIVEALRGHASRIAWEGAMAGEGTEEVGMKLEGILKALRAGGFEFRGLTPLREINAALINVTGVRKLDEEGAYTVENLDEVVNAAVVEAHEDMGHR